MTAFWDLEDFHGQQHRFVPVNNFEIRPGDALEVLRTLPAEGIQCCITRHKALRSGKQAYIVSQSNGRVANQCELNADYIEMVHRRIADDAPLLNAE